MPLKIVHADITRLSADAIVNAANSTLHPGGGVSNAIFKQAGPELSKACKKIGLVKTGCAVITNGYKTKARYIIHAVGPVWKGGGSHEEELLSQTYVSALELALENDVRSIAFPLISAGAFGFPPQAALEIAVRTISRFLAEKDSDLYVILTFIDRSRVSRVSEETRFNLPLFLRKAGSCLEENARLEAEAPNETDLWEAEAPAADMLAEDLPCAAAPARQDDGLPSMNGRRLLRAPAPAAPAEEFEDPGEVLRILSGDDKDLRAIYIDRITHALGADYVDYLYELMRQKGFEKNADVYNKANITRQTFSKLICGTRKPTKNITLALAIGLRLDLEETAAFLKVGGWTFAPGDVRDNVIKLCITSGNYNIFDINRTLFKCGQKQLGWDF